jgi:probable HAF family extracellular repeat protein
MWSQRYSLGRFVAMTLLVAGAFPSGVRAQSHWQVKSSNTTSSLNAVTFGNGLFVAVGDHGAIVTSPNGNVWTPRASGTTDQLPAIAFGNGRFVATRANRDIPGLTSADGINWTPVTVTDSNGAPADTGAFEMIVFGDGRFMAAGSMTSPSTDLMASTDGLSFRIIIPAHYPDPFPLNISLTTLGYFRGKFYGSGSSEYYYASSDGVSWKQTGWYGEKIFATDGVSKVVLAEGAYPRFSIDAAHTFQRGESLMDWYLPPSNFTPLLRAACYGAGVFVAVDRKGGAWTSARGEFWAPKGYSATAGEEFRSVVFDGVSRFVAVGTAPTSGTALIAAADADPPLPPPPAYSIVSLKALSNGSLEEVWGISNSGSVAGTVLRPSRLAMAATFRDGIVTSYPVTTYASRATAINDSGVTALEVTFPYLTWAYAFPEGSQLMAGPHLYATAAGINANGSIVGGYQSYPMSDRMGIYRHDTATQQTVDLGNFGYPFITANGINDLGEIAGTVSSHGGLGIGERAYRLSANGEMIIIPNLGGLYAYCTALNVSGNVVGFSNMPHFPDTLFETHAFLFKNGSLLDIDTFNSRGSMANAMNSNDEVVGSYTTVEAEHEGFAQHAFLYRNGAMYDLNTLFDGSGDGWMVSSATGINDAGWIVGQGWLHGSSAEPFLAIPASGSPAGVQTRFVNVSTRLSNGTGDDVLIGGFIIRGGAKRVIIRGLGPSLAYLGFPSDFLSDPVLELLDGNGQRIALNDNFTDLSATEQNDIGLYLLTPIGGSLILDSVIMATLAEGNYTAVVRGKNGATGNCLVEVYNVDKDYTHGLVNISTRGPVGTGDNVMIAGFIIRGDREKRIIVRGIGPSLAASGVPNVLSDPTVEILDQDGSIIQNDDWRSQQEAEIVATGLAPGDDRESAAILSLWPGSYTAVLRGKNNTSGNALVEVYELN